MKPRKVSESRTYMSMVMQPSDANTMGNVHGGVIMRQMDNAGGVAAKRHARRNVVTASIDSLDFHNPCYIGDLLLLRASVNYTGRSSMEVGVRVEAESLATGEVRHIASGYLTFVALDENRKPSPIPQIEPETDEDRQRYKAGEERRRERLRQKGRS